jgi:hypothetical protein
MNALCRNFTLGLVLLLGAMPAGAQWQEQSIRLTAGWNAVFLEVQPEPSDADAVFAGLPIESAWMWDRPGQQVEFVDDPQTLVPGRPEWLTYLPEGHPHQAAKNLLEVIGGRALLIQLVAGAPALEWTVRGRPTRPKYEWVADSYNLAGFPLASNSIHTVSTLFASSPAHRGSPVLKLEPSGRWTRMDTANERLVGGRAYWIFTRGPSAFSGPLEVATDQGRNVDFGDAGVEAVVRLGNGTTQPRTYGLSLLPSAAAPDGQARVAGGVRLWHRRFTVDESTGAPRIDWLELSNRLEVVVPPGEGLAVRLEARRAALPPAAAPDALLHQSLLEISDDSGYREHLPVSLRRSAAAAARSPGLQATAATPENPRAGLWVGNVTLDKVSYSAHPSDPFLLRPARSEFDFRIIIHVDAAGQARLLRSVALFQRRQTNENRLVLVTDPAAVSRLGLTGVALRDGQPVARRFTAPAFAFSDPVEMTSDGPFGEGSVRCTVHTGHDDPLSPFKHVYHPDHDNLEETTRQKLGDGVESFAVSRELELRFTAGDPLPGHGTGSPHVPGYGDTRLGGVYSETIAGVHRRAIHVGGIFTLQRVAFVSVLNDGETD